MVLLFCSLDLIILSYNGGMLVVSLNPKMKKQIDAMVERLESELLGKGAAETATVASPEEARIKEYEIKQQKD